MTKPEARPPAAPSTASGAAAPVDAADLVRGRLMAQSLKRLLDRVQGARQVLPHLAALERSLGEKGASAIGRIPPHWLDKIGTQLRSLPMPEGDPAFKDLLGRLLDALDAKRAAEVELGGFDPEQTVLISEVSHSEFDAASAEQDARQRPVDA